MFLTLTFGETTLLGGVGATALFLVVVALARRRATEPDGKRGEPDATSTMAVDSGESANDEPDGPGGSEGSADGGGDGGGD